jgi:hypothetical protein
MVDPVTVWIFIGAVLVPLVVTVMWPYITELFSRVIIPTIRKILGDQVADAVAAIVSWVDNPVSVGRGALLDAWRRFKSRVLGIKTTWKVERDTAVETTEKYLLHENGREVEVMTSTRRVPRENLPSEIRARMMRMGTDVAELDVAGALQQQVAEKARERGIVLEHVG